MMLSTEDIKQHWQAADFLYYMAVQEESIEHLEKPFLQLHDREQVFVLYCTPELYSYVQELESISDESDFNIVRMSRLYLEIKKMLRHGIKRIPSATQENLKSKGEETDAKKETGS